MGPHPYGRGHNHLIGSNFCGVHCLIYEDLQSKVFRKRKEMHMAFEWKGKERIGEA